jgi:hypothetical protein
MPKVLPSRRNRPQTSTAERRVRAERIVQESVEMDFRCKRCEEKNLRCFVETTTGRCAGCISVAADCSLFASEQEWEAVQSERQEKELEVARLRAQLAQRELELLEVKGKERSFARRDLALLDLQERATVRAEEEKTPGTESSVAHAPSDFWADPGWLQADFDFSDPSFDLTSLLENPGSVSLDYAGGTNVPVTCSSSSFLLVPRCSGYPAIRTI